MNLHHIAKRLLSGKLDLDDAIDMLATNEGLLRWFTADCAQRVLKREQAERRQPPPVANEAIEAARRWVLGTAQASTLSALGQAVKQASFECSDDDDLPSLTLQEMAWLTARDTVFAMTQTPPTGLTEPTKQTSQEAANEAAWTASFSLPPHTNKRRAWATAQGNEFSWQCNRLAYLCEVWATCGERAPQLLFQNACPLPPPCEARI